MLDASNAPEVDRIFLIFIIPTIYLLWNGPIWCSIYYRTVICIRIQVAIRFVYRTCSTV